jgi:hypothetical protein
MGDGNMRRAAEQLLREARAMVAAYPSPTAPAVEPIRPLPDDAGGEQALARALANLRDEMALVRAGTAGGVVVLADEIACVERELERR